MERQDLPLKYLWTARFEDGHVISQPADDRYSKHDDAADWNPSAFRDIQDYDKAPLASFELASVTDKHDRIAVFFGNGSFVRLGNVSFTLEKPGEDIINRKLIYYRTRQVSVITGEQFISSYTFGYQGFDKITKKVVEKTITI